MSALQHPALSKFTVPFKVKRTGRGHRFWWPAIFMCLMALLLVGQTDQFLLTTSEFVGTDAMLWIMLAIFSLLAMCAVGCVSLFIYEKIVEMSIILMIFSLIPSVFIFLIGANFLPSSSSNWVGMFQLERIQRVENAIVSIKKETRGKVLPTALARAERDMSPENLYQAHAFVSTNWWGEEFNRGILSARLLGLSADPAFQEALHQGWLSKKQSDKWAKELREHPPEILRASPLHQAAYLRMIGEVSIDTKINIEGKEK